MKKSLTEGSKHQEFQQLFEKQTEINKKGKTTVN